MPNPNCFYCVCACLFAFFVCSVFPVHFASQACSKCFPIHMDCFSLNAFFNCLEGCGAIER